MRITIQNKDFIWEPDVFFLYDLQHLELDDIVSAIPISIDTVQDVC